MKRFILCTASKASFICLFIWLKCGTYQLNQHEGKQKQQEIVCMCDEAQKSLVLENVKGKIFINKIEGDCVSRRVFYANKTLNEMSSFLFCHFSLYLGHCILCPISKHIKQHMDHFHKRPVCVFCFSYDCCLSLPTFNSVKHTTHHHRMGDSHFHTKSLKRKFEYECK